MANCTAGDPLEPAEDPEPDGRGGAVVLVGIRLDAQSRELLTWALVKVARSGDRVIAVHVLNPQTEGKSTLLSLVQTFDSVLSAYEGFCSLKQVDLKLKVFRDSSVRKVLVQEAKSYATAKVVLGTSKVQTFRSSVSIAKYCARNLPKKYAVFAVENGKILYQREATDSIYCYISGTDQSNHSLSKRKKELKNAMADAVSSKSSKRHQHCLQEFNSPDETLNDGSKESSQALVQIKSQQLPVSKHGWVLLRRVLLHNQQASDRFSLKKSMFQWALKLPSRQSLESTCPDHKQNKLDRKEGHSVNLENSAVVPSVAGVASFSPPSHCFERFSEELEGLTEKYSSVFRLFSYQELLSATANFRHDNLVGKGGSSQVFKGCLADGEEVAVKVLKPSKNVFRAFVQEIEIITTLHHKNTISLLGFCSENGNLILVYDFLSRGSLEENLNRNRNKAIVFGWEVRYKVALGVAKALDYLHCGAAEPVIHRDVKSSNILLSDDFEPKLSDFGLAMWASDSSNQVTNTDVAGTFGYLAPEYFMHGKVNGRIDVYAFGVVLLELLSGRKPIDNQNPKGPESLVMWAHSIVNGGEVYQFLDPSLVGKYDHDQSERMILAALLCIRSEPQFRPEINLVLKLLQGDADAIEWARQQVNASEEIDDVGAEGFRTNTQSHLNVELLNIEEYSLSSSSTHQTILVEDYLQGRSSNCSSSEKSFLAG